MSKLRLASALGLGLCAAAALAATPVGTWKGKIVVNMASLPGMPPNMTAQQKTAMMNTLKAQMAQMSISAVFKPGGTYTATVSGSPMPAANRASTGKWTQKGNTITITSTDPRAKGKSQTMTLSPNGKTLTATAPNGMGKIIFTR